MPAAVYYIYLIFWLWKQTKLILLKHCHKAAMLNGVLPLFHSVYMLTVNPTQPSLKQQAAFIQSHHVLYLILMNPYELISK